MATDDVQRLVTGTAPAPATFTVPGNGQIRPKSVFASFDGTAAGGAFLPALKIVSDAGQTVGIYPCATQVAAGASADVSWFPHLAAAAAAPPPSGSGLNWAYIDGSTNKVCNSGAVSLLTARATRFYTNAPAVFTHGVDGAGNIGIVISSAGHFWSVYTVQPFGVPTANSHWSLSQNGGGNVAGNDYLNWVPLNPNGPGSDDWTTNDGELSTVGGTVPAPTAPIIGRVNNDGAFNVTLGPPQNYVIQLDTNSTDLV